MNKNDRYKLQPHWPEEYKGYKVSDLMQVLKDICSSKGTKADRDMIGTMREFLHEYKCGIHGIEPQEGEIVVD